MCGRYAVSLDVDQLYQGFVGFGDVTAALPTTVLDTSGRGRWSSESAEGLRWEPRFSLAPTDRAPILLEAFDEDGTLHRELTMARWDLRPDGSTRPGAPVFNARLETVAEKPLFADAFARRRALVPMSGYYEWTREPGGKRPHYLHGSDGRPLAVAGLWGTREHHGRHETAFAMLTRPGVDEAGRIHDRMPALLPDEAWDDWLSPVTGGSPAALRDLVHEASGRAAERVRTHRVDARLNDVRRLDPSDPSLIEEAGAEPQPALTF